MGLGQSARSNTVTRTAISSDLSARLVLLIAASCHVSVNIEVYDLPRAPYTKTLSLFLTHPKTLNP